MREVRNLSRAGLLIAASVVLVRLFGVMLPLAGVGALRLSFGDVPIIMASLFLGPVWGALVGASSDLIGFAINPMGGPYFPGLTLSAALVGVLPWYFLRLFSLGRPKAPGFWRYLLVIACSDLITSVILNTYWIHVMYSKAIIALLPARVAARIILVPIFASLVTLTAQVVPVSLPSPARAAKKA